MATVTDLMPSDFAVLVLLDDFAGSGYIWASTSYERDDATEYNSTIPVAAAPELGSTHTMTVGLVPVS